MTDAEPPLRPRRRLEVLGRARVDIDNILLFTQQEWGSAQRTRYRRLIARAIKAIGDFPEIGVSRPDWIDGGRSFPAGQHVVYYRLTDESISVVRVLHSRQDWTDELDG